MACYMYMFTRLHVHIYLPQVHIDEGHTLQTLLTGSYDERLAECANKICASIINKSAAGTQANN